MLFTVRLLGALAAAALLVAPAPASAAAHPGSLAAASAKKKPPKSPTKAAVRKLLVDAYGDGSSVGQVRRLSFSSVTVGKARRIRPAADLLRPGWLWPARARFTMRSTIPGSQFLVEERWDARIHVYRDDFRRWKFKNWDIKSRKIRCVGHDGAPFSC